MLLKVFLTISISLISQVYTINQCSPTYACPDFYTCCFGVRGWGCCPGVNATCCGDGISCCPPRTICDLRARICIPKVVNASFITNIDGRMTQKINATVYHNVSPSIMVNFKAFFEGLIEGLNLYNEIPALKECSIFSDKLMVDIGIIMEKVYDFDEDKKKSSFVGLAIAVKEFLKDFQTSSEGCEKTLEQYFSVMEKVFAYVSDDNYVEKITQLGLKNFEEIKSKIERIKNEHDSFIKGSMIGEVIIKVLFPEYK